MQGYRGDKYHYSPKRKHCLIPRCNEELKPRRIIRLCPSCRWALGFGGVAVGALLKLGEWLLAHWPLLSRSH